VGGKSSRPTSHASDGRMRAAAGADVWKHTCGAEPRSEVVMVVVGMAVTQQAGSSRAGPGEGQKRGWACHISTMCLGCKPPLLHELQPCPAGIPCAKMAALITASSQTVPPSILFRCSQAVHRTHLSGAL
jgi:hypothetical protein